MEGEKYEPSYEELQKAKDMLTRSQEQVLPARLDFLKALKEANLDIPEEFSVERRKDKKEVCDVSGIFSGHKVKLEVILHKDGGAEGLSGEIDGVG